MLYSKYFKRLLDFIFALLFFILFWWILLLISGAILIFDGFPILFIQSRVGQYGRPFKIYKFRTMVKDAERIGPKSTSAGDARITPIGKFLRKTSLDELMQIFNILKGDMSFVGFRPGVFENYKESDYESGIFNVKPGISGYAQVYGRSGLTLAQKREWEKQYVQDISFMTDMKILARTISIALIGRGAY